MGKIEVGQVWQKRSAKSAQGLCRGMPAKLHVLAVSESDQIITVCGWLGPPPALAMPIERKRLLMCYELLAPSRPQRELGKMEGSK